MHRVFGGHNDCTEPSTGYNFVSCMARLRGVAQGSFGRMLAVSDTTRSSFCFATRTSGLRSNSGPGCVRVCAPKKRASRLSRRQTRSGSTRPSCASTRAWNPSRRLRWQILAWGPPPEPERMRFAGQQNSPLSRCMTLEVTVVGSPVSRSQARPSPVETPPLVCLPPGSEPSSAASRRKTGTGVAVGLAVDR